MTASQGLAPIVDTLIIQQQWEACTLTLKGNRFAVFSSGNSVPTAIDLCFVQPWRPTNDSEGLPLNEGAVFFNCNGIVTETGSYGSIVCCASDPSETWMGLMMAASAQMPLHNLRVVAEHDTAAHGVLVQRFGLAPEDISASKHTQPLRCDTSLLI
jgi:hypothetical protein